MIAIAVVARACSSAHAHAPAVDPGAPAGDVTEISGDVHATCDGKTRALAKGDTVAGDDTITTGTDGRVTIVLRRNHVPWSLGPGLSKKVSESAAWSAAAPAAGEVATDDHSAAAGRHAERSATDTGASAPVAPTTTTTTPPPPTVQPQPDTIAGPLDGQHPGDAIGQGGLGLKGTGPGGGGTGEGTIGLGNLGTIGHGAGGTGQGYGAGNGALGGARGPASPKVTFTVTVQGALAKEIVQRVVRPNFGRVRLCYERALANDPTAQGTVTVKLAVGKDGAVSGATPAASTVTNDLASCIAHAAGALAFPTADSITLVTIQYTLAPPD